MTEQEKILTSQYKITRVEINDDGYGITYYAETDVVPFERMFPIVNIESVSLSEDFLQYEPENRNGKRIKSNIILAKEIGMKNFRKPCMDPCFEYGRTIKYCAGEKPALGRPPFWWSEIAKYFMPKKKSRLINEVEKDVHLGILIKCLVEEKKINVKQAWDLVCNDSRDLVDYYNIWGEIGKTGNMYLGRWSDLDNTTKIVKKYTGLGYVCYSKSTTRKYSLADTMKVINHPNYVINNALGEIVLDE